ncbi:hypothetical protein PTKIN_Ptkin09bG0066700 [Pterospermum kingtungense]
MGKRREKIASRSQTLPSSPSHSFSSSSSSSDFEFRISLSPRAKSSSTLCPADELFYKGQLLPLHLSPRLSMVRTLLLASSSTSTSSSSATASRDSTGSSNDSQYSSYASDLVLLAPDCDSSRPSSVTEDDEFKRLNNGNGNQLFNHHQHGQIKRNKYFSLSRFSSVFKKENNNKNHDQDNTTAAASSSVKKMSTTAKEVIRKYLKKVKPLYEKLSQKQQQKMGGFGVGIGIGNGGVSALSSTTSGPASFCIKPGRSVKDIEKTNNARRESNNNGGFSHSFSGNLRYPRRRSCVSSCPSSMRSSPSHSGVLSTMGTNTGRVGGSCMHYYSDTSSMEELQSAIQGAIAHCKNSLLQNKPTVVSNKI